jgi:two-component system, NarL family, sensor histidine kinase DevS
VIKHAEASSAVVSVSEAAETVELAIRDDGRGFDPATQSRGFGLLGMRERIALAGGTLEVQARPGEGTEIRVRLPVRFVGQDLTAFDPYQHEVGSVS